MDKLELNSKYQNITNHIPIKSKSESKSLQGTMTQAALSYLQGQIRVSIKSFVAIDCNSRWTLKSTFWMNLVSHEMAMARGETECKVCIARGKGSILIIKLKRKL